PSDPHQILEAINLELGLAGDRPLLLPDGVPERDRGLPFDLCARLSELERMCLALIRERRVETLAASFLDAARRVLHADCAALCLLDRGERNVRHLETWKLESGLLASHAQDEARLPGMLLRARAPLRLVEGDAMLSTLP